MAFSSPENVRLEGLLIAAKVLRPSEVLISALPLLSEVPQPLCLSRRNQWCPLISTYMDRGIVRRLG